MRLPLSRVGGFYHHSEEVNSEAFLGLMSQGGKYRQRMIVKVTGSPETPWAEGLAALKPATCVRLGHAQGKSFAWRADQRFEPCVERGDRIGAIPPPSSPTVVTAPLIWARMRAR